MSEDGTKRLAWARVDWLVRAHIPALLGFVGIPDHGEALRRLPEIDGLATLDAAISLLDDVPCAIDRVWERAISAAEAGRADTAGMAVWEAARSIEREALTRRVCAAVSAELDGDERLELVWEAAEGIALFARLYAGLEAGLVAARSVPRRRRFDRMGQLAARAAAIEALHRHRNEAYATTVAGLDAGLPAPAPALQIA